MTSCARSTSCSELRRSVPWSSTPNGSTRPSSSYVRCWTLTSTRTGPAARSSTSRSPVGSTRRTCRRTRSATTCPSSSSSPWTAGTCSSFLKEQDAIADVAEDLAVHAAPAGLGRRRRPSSPGPGVRRPGHQVSAASARGGPRDPNPARGILRRARGGRRAGDRGRGNRQEWEADKRQRTWAGAPRRGGRSGRRFRRPVDADLKVLGPDGQPRGEHGGHPPLMLPGAEPAAVSTSKPLALVLGLSRRAVHGVEYRRQRRGQRHGDLRGLGGVEPDGAPWCWRASSSSLAPPGRAPRHGHHPQGHHRGVRFATTARSVRTDRAPGLSAWSRPSWRRAVVAAGHDPAAPGVHDALHRGRGGRDRMVSLGGRRPCAGGRSSRSRELVRLPGAGRLHGRARRSSSSGDGILQSGGSRGGHPQVGTALSGSGGDRR